MEKPSGDILHGRILYGVMRLHFLNWTSGSDALHMLFVRRYVPVLSWIFSDLLTVSYSNDSPFFITALVSGCHALFKMTAAVNFCAIYAPSLYVPPIPT